MSLTDTFIQLSERGLMPDFLSVRAYATFVKSDLNSARLRTVKKMHN